MTARYELECTECPFRTTVVGEFADVFDEIHAHQAERGAGPDEHFVNVHRRTWDSSHSGDE